jgi:hypothetical protein
MTPIEHSIHAAGLPLSRRARLALHAGAILLLLAGCRAPSASEPGHPVPDQPQGTKVAQTLQIKRHFSGPELALAQAAAAGNRDEVVRLVRAGADPDAVSPGGLPLVAWPILQGNADGVGALLDSGANPNRPVPAAGTVMTWAAKAGDPRILEAFLERGGDANASSRDREPLTRVAALAGRWDNVQRLVEHGAAVDAAAQDDEGDTLLAYYSAGQFDKAHWLLEHGADPEHRITKAAAPGRVGARPIVENIYWWPVQAGRFPELAQWQQRCQDLLAARGITAPAEPAHLARLRASQQGGSNGDPATPHDLDAETREGEAAIRAEQRDH